jgi:hypothetical protein
VKPPVYDTTILGFGNPTPFDVLCHTLFPLIPPDQSRRVYVVLNDVRTLILNLCGSATTASNNLALRSINPSFQLSTENGSDYTLDPAKF